MKLKKVYFLGWTLKKTRPWTRLPMLRSRGRKRGLSTMFWLHSTRSTMISRILSSRSHSSFVALFQFQRLLYLGGRVTENISEATHLVSALGTRSDKILEAIALGKNIVHPFWIIHGFECGHFMGEFYRQSNIEQICLFAAILDWFLKRIRLGWARQRQK